MVPSVVMGVVREGLALVTLPPAKLVETVPVTVPRVVTPRRNRQFDAAASIQYTSAKMLLIS